MLVEIGSINNVPAYIKKVKAGEKLLMGLVIASTRITIRAPKS